MGHPSKGRLRFSVPGPVFCAAAESTRQAHLQITPMASSPQMARGRMTLGLYNSYDPVKFAEAHRRAIARAAPVALAFDANVATFGFPFERELRTPQRLAVWVSGTTSIGEEGKYLRELAEAGRLLTFDFPRRGFPPQLGDVVVTTNRPDAKKGVDAVFLARLLDKGTS